jgi:hypothetical protein
MSIKSIQASPPCFQLHITEGAPCIDVSGYALSRFSGYYSSNFVDMAQFSSIDEALLFLRGKYGRDQPPPANVMSLSLTMAISITEVYSDVTTTPFLGVSCHVIRWERCPTNDQVGLNLLPAEWKIAQCWPKNKEPPEWLKKQEQNAQGYVEVTRGSKGCK